MSSAAAVQLTPGAVAVISELADGNGKLKPVLQVMEVKLVTNSKSPTAAERYRMLLSDGVHTLQSMLATAENYRIKDRAIVKGTIVNLQEFTCSTIQGRRIIIVIKLDILQTECPIIGSPVAYVSKNIPREHGPNVATTAAQSYTGNYSGSPGALGSSVAPRLVQVANNLQCGGGGSYTGFQGTVAAPVDRAVEPVPNVSYGGSYGTMSAQGTVATPVGRAIEPVPNASYGGSCGTMSAHSTMNASMMQSKSQQPPLNSHENLTREQCPNVATTAAQTYSGTYSGGPGALGSSVATRPVQVVNNLQCGGGGSYTGFQGTVAAPADRTVEPVSNVSYGGSYGTMSAHNTMNASMMQSKSQQPQLSSHQNQRFAVPATAGSVGPPGNTYGRPTQPMYHQAAPAYINRGPACKNDATFPVVPIAQLNPYQSMWTIKARVTAKTHVKHYTNAKGPGKVFSFDLLDAHGGEIRATGFNAQLDLFYNLIEVDKVYLMSGGNLKLKEKKFNSLNHEYEITLNHSSSIQICPDDNSIPRQQYNFRQISELESMEIGASVDVVGVVTSVSPSFLVTTRRDGSEVQKQSLQLKDMSGRSVEVTFWGNRCDAEGHQLQVDCDSGFNPILALKNAIISEYNGVSLSTNGSTHLKINPEFPEAEKLRHWYETEGRTAACVSLSQVKSSMGGNDVRKTVAQVKDEDLGRNGKPDFITVKGSVSHLKADNFFYPACTKEVNGRQCNKKVTNNGDGTWFCEKCDQASPNCEYRYILNFQIQDHTGVTWATAFQEPGVVIIGCSAQELSNIKEEDEAKFAEVIQGIRFQMFLFKVKLLEETFNDESRVKWTITTAEKLDPLKESGYLLGAIDSILQEDAGTHPEVQAATAYTAGFNNSEQSVPTSNNAYTANMGGAMYRDSSNQFGQQINTRGGLSTPVSTARNVQNCLACGASGHNAQNCPAAMYRQQTTATPASSYGSSAGDAGRDANMFPGAGAVPQPQPYGNDAAAGGYNRQSYVGATNYSY